MCLCISKKAEFEKAKKDIVFYKVLEREKNEKFPFIHTYKTPYMGVEVKLRKRYDENEDAETKELFFSDYIEKGVIHLFANYDNAVDRADRTRNGCVVKAVIPKGSEYIKGYFYPAIGYSVPSIGAKSVIYKRVVYKRL